jgi:SAM-dependent methyltransferase
MMNATMPATGSAIRNGPLWGRRARAWAENEEQQVPTFEEAFARTSLSAGHDYLDIGCGTGVALATAVERGAEVSGIDASEELVGIARERVPGADIRVGDMQSLPFEDDSFDLVTGFNSFFFAADMISALREAGRVAKPGAPVVIQVWGPPENCDLTAMKESVFPLGPPPPEDTEEEAPALHDPGVLEAIATEAGLTPGDAFELTYAFDYPDRESLVRRLSSPGPVVLAIEHAGEPRVAEAIAHGLEPFRRDDGSYRLMNQWRYLVATAPGQM